MSLFVANLGMANFYLTLLFHYRCTGGGSLLHGHVWTVLHRVSVRGTGQCAHLRATVPQGQGHQLLQGKEIREEEWWRLHCIDILWCSLPASIADLSISDTKSHFIKMR